MSLSELVWDIEGATVVYEQEIGAYTARTRHIIERYGVIEALSKLVVSPELQTGFRILRDRGKLELTFEALVVRHQALFRKDVIQAAQWRLTNAKNLL